MGESSDPTAQNGRLHQSPLQKPRHWQQKWSQELLHSDSTKHVAQQGEQGHMPGFHWKAGNLSLLDASEWSPGLAPSHMKQFTRQPWLVLDKPSVSALAVILSMEPTSSTALRDSSMTTKPRESS